ncbi:hypothetical protein NDN08_002585 [Rhodosorus marinus]|uniref:La-related protein 7 n=1 Tax=Rhodosorus marinus TaxID=101924 RepID=A0AAV8UZW2_9RHOD|nr:hypothetical protein NDN08_002585 [Rhodosorus marinus]
METQLEEEEKRMEGHLVNWLSGEVGGSSISLDKDGYAEASSLASLRRSRRMGFSVDMILTVGRKSKLLEVHENQIRRSQREAKKSAIVKLLEFWFGAHNLRRDKFLGKLLREAADGMVSVDKILTFNKLKVLNSTKEELLSAMEAVPSLLKLSENRERVGRVKPMEEEPLPEGNPDQRTVYIETISPETTHEKIAELVEKFGKVGYISMPRFKDGTIKGFAFVEFELESSAKACVEQRTLKTTHDEELIVISKLQWLAMKEELKSARKERKERGMHAKQVQNFGYPIGTLVKVGGLSEAVKRQEIYDALQTITPVAFVDFKRSTPEICFARFYTASSASKVEEALSGGSLQIGSRKVVARILTGQEESDQWKIIHKQTEEKEEKKKKGGGDPATKEDGSGTEELPRQERAWNKDEKGERDLGESEVRLNKDVQGDSKGVKRPAEEDPAELNESKKKKTKKRTT